MSKSQRRATRKILSRQGDIPQDTILNNDGRLLLTQSSLLSIANHVSKKIGRKLTEGEVEAIDSHVGRLPPSQFEGQTIGDAQKRIAAGFLERHNLMIDTMTEEMDLGSLLDLHEETDQPDLHWAQRKQLEGLTTDENDLKYSMHHNRRGDSVVDRDNTRVRIMRERGAPNRILSGPGHDMQAAQLQGAEAGHGQLVGAGGDSMTGEMLRNNLRLNKELVKYTKSLRTFFNAENIEEIFARSRKTLTTFGTVTLPHQVVPLDSRFRVVTHNEPGEYLWNIHAAGEAGRPGDIRMGDTVKELMFMKICPFWIPVADGRNQYYDKVRMFIKEFKAQSVQVNEFVDCDQGCVARPHNYHFEFIATRRGNNRIHLEPICPIFIFRKPMAQANTITVEFRSPFEKIIFDADRLSFTIDHLNPAEFTTTNGEDHNLATGDLIYVCNFTSGTQAINNLMNRQEGHVITRLGDDLFSINVDLSGVAGGPTENIEVQFGSKRIIGQIELISLEQ